ncbi:hypothetical protein WJX74_008678 [Apatococcus lobatus]|uniref:Uncharacterized protein n=1 Tax=Apatococcus lobatus TaxID=904363 RepID=A0AAW1RF86_9CHLO
MGYRFTRQDSTGHSPYLLMYGRYPVLPGGVVQDNPGADTQAPLDESIDRHASASSGLQQSALARVEKAQDWQIHSHASRHIHGKTSAKVIHPDDLAPGSYVHHRPPAGAGHKRKLASSSIIMHFVSINRIGTTCVLRDAQGREAISHISNITPYKLSG